MLIDVYDQRCPEILNDKKRRFENRVIGWRATKEIFGSWKKAAAHFETDEVSLIRIILEDLDTVWGEKLNWKGIS